MRFYKNYQDNIQRKHCEHVFTLLERNYGATLMKCIRCYRIIEEGA